MIQRLQDWLFGAVQIDSGQHCGAVIGSISSADGPEFLYPEVTGYFLTWLAFLGPTAGDELVVSARAQRAVSWLKRESTFGKMPATRYHLSGRRTDWRNRALFSFDLAMVCRGIAAVRDRIPGGLAEECLAQVLMLFRRFCDGDGSLAAVLPTGAGSGNHLPCRWSTAPGPYQLKPAAAILGLPRWLAGSDLHDEMKRVYGRWREHYLRNPIPDELHPVLYSLEGLVLAAGLEIDPDGREIASRIFPLVMERIERRCSRSDVLAQALRIGCLLGINGQHAPFARPALDGMAEALGRFFDENGAPVFRRVLPDKIQQWNTWSAIFSHQALIFLDQLDSAEGRPALELLA